MTFQLEIRWILKKFLLLSLCLAWILAGQVRFTPHALAQSETPPAASGAEYIVQEGDSLWSIALRFRVSIDDLSAANGIGNANQLAVGDRLLIPGLEGLQGTLTTAEVNFGENLTSISRRYNLPAETIIRLNHLTSPSELYAGATLVLLEGEKPASSAQRSVLAPDQSLLELSVLENVSAWSYALNNRLEAPVHAAPGEVLHLPASSAQPSPQGAPVPALSPGALPDAIHSVVLTPLPFIQGKTAAIQIEAESGLTFGGTLNDHPLYIFPEGETAYSGLQGLHAMTEPGLYPLVITGTLPGGAQFAFSQSVFVADGGYVFDPVLTVSPETIDPAVTRPEDAEWAALTNPVTPERLWSGKFASPAPPPYSDCWPSQYGSRRSYNGSAYQYFHTGLDFCGGVGAEILAPASGRVVFAGPLTVRGNATVIDHGQGVYTGYLHQSEILVGVGDQVEPGQIIGRVGGTGRVTGPHLHWEVWVGGVQIDPMDWLLQLFPPST